MEQLIITEKANDAYLIMEMKGPINSYTYQDFQDKLYAKIKKNSICLDMQGITSLSSAGLGVLMSAHEDAEESGNKLFILKPSEIVKMSIISTGFYDTFKIVNTTNEIQI